jgi:hypothetical protein
MRETAVGLANYFCADPQSLRQAFDTCGLTPKERDYLFATVELRRGTAARGALAAGVRLDSCPSEESSGSFLKVQWNSVVGHACSKIAGQLGWKKPSTGMWIDLLVTFERKAAYGLDDTYEEGKESFTWVVRPEWVEALR